MRSRGSGPPTIVLVPFYNLHKVLAGLAGHAQVRRPARSAMPPSAWRGIRRVAPRTLAALPNTADDAGHRVRRHERGACTTSTCITAATPHLRGRRGLRRHHAVPVPRDRPGRAPRHAREHDHPEADRRAEALHGLHRQSRPVRDADGRRRRTSCRCTSTRRRTSGRSSSTTTPTRTAATASRSTSEAPTRCTQYATQQGDVGQRADSPRDLQRVQHAQAVAGAVPADPGREVRGLLRERVHQHDPVVAEPRDRHDDVLPGHGSGLQQGVRHAVRRSSGAASAPAWRTSRSSATRSTSGTGARST